MGSLHAADYYAGKACDYDDWLLESKLWLYQDQLVLVYRNLAGTHKSVSCHKGREHQRAYWLRLRQQTI